MAESLYDILIKEVIHMSTGFWIFLGVFAAVGIGIGVIYFVLRNKLRHFSRQYLGGADLKQLLKESEQVENMSPRSLSGCDSLLLPKILKDFPDFDSAMAKSSARNALREKLGSRPGFTIYNVVISKYLTAATQKTVVLQAALSYRENNATVQKRYDLHYAYVVTGSSENVASTCPNCGGAVGYGEASCPYCGSAIAYVLSNCWKITEIQES